MGSLRLFFEPKKEGAERNEFVFFDFLKKIKKTNSFLSEGIKKIKISALQQFCHKCPELAPIIRENSCNSGQNWVDCSFPPP
jgi:hypothetical protein